MAFLFPGLRSCARGALGLIVIAGLVALVPAPSSAQDAGRDEEARSLFEAGRTAFAAGRFESALARFREAYELSGRTALLYNIGTAADRLRRDAEALEAFRAYVAAEPGAENRGEVEARIAVLERAVAAAEPAPAVAPEPEPEPIAVASPAMGTEDDRAASGGGGSVIEEWWFWTLIGVVVVGAGVGIGVGVAVSSGETVQGPLPGSGGAVAIALGAW
jgi:tetratricopeptide (TPR) repeat protein